jgi:hypothetical protein
VSELQEEKMPVPAPSTMDQLAGDPNRGDAVLFLVESADTKNPAEARIPRLQ